MTPVVTPHITRLATKQPVTVSWSPREHSATAAGANNLVTAAQTEDAKTVRDVQKRFTQKYLKGLKENKQLKHQVAELSAAKERIEAAAQAEAAALTQKLDVAQEAAAVDVRDMTENVLELEAKLKCAEQQLKEAAQGSASPTAAIVPALHTHTDVALSVLRPGPGVWSSLVPSISKP